MPHKRCGQYQFMAVRSEKRMDDSIGYQWSKLSGKKGIQLLLQTALVEWRKLARKEKGGIFALIFPPKEVVSVGYTCACTWFTSCNRNRIYICICIFFFSGLADLIPLKSPNTGSEFSSTAENRRETWKLKAAARKTTETKLQWRKFTRPEHLTMNRYNTHSLTYVSARYKLCCQSLVKDISIRQTTISDFHSNWVQFTYALRIYWKCDCHLKSDCLWHLWV